MGLFFSNDLPRCMNHRMRENLFYMGEALKLAKQGMGYVGANPMVGALFVKEGKIIGTGYHQKFGGPHAEVNALTNLLEQGFDALGSTLYCTLEPCSHTNKKTPPCAQMLATLGLKKVVIATLDPNPEVSGRGVEILKASGIEVEIGVLSDEAFDLNKRFFYHIEHRRPFIALKWAQTIDGYLALKDNQAKYLTSIEARVDVHHDRQLYENILIGGETLRVDNPKLDCRNFNIHYHPNRFILTDLKKYSHLNYEVFTDNFTEKTYVLTQKCKEDLAKKNKDELLKRKVNVIEYGEGDSLQKIFTMLYEMKFSGFYVEAGAKIFETFCNENLVNEMIVYIAPKFSNDGCGKKLGLGKGAWHLLESLQIGDDVKLTYKKA